MAKFNEILVGRYNKALTKIFSMKGQAPAPQIASEITPAISMFYGAENRILEAWNLYAQSVLVTATVGQTNAVQLRNAGNLLVVLEKLIVSCGVAQEIDLSTQAGVPGNLSGPSQNGQAREFRSPPQSPTLLNTAIDSPAPLTAIIARVQLAANVPFEFIIHEDQQLPINGLRITQTVANSSLMVTCWWRERALEETERTA